jgi:hypothetical protein
MLPKDSEALAQWPDLAFSVGSWMEDAKQIAVAGYRQMLEDGPDMCGSETDA